MTLEQLKYLCAIVEKGSFRAAAESVFRSQSSLSISIQKLEQSLGIQLFLRDGYRPALTKQGQAIYQKAKMMLKKDEEIHELAKHLAVGNEAEVRLAVSGIVPIEPVIATLNLLNKQYPAMRFSLWIENLGGTMERLQDDDADIVITDSFEMMSDYESIALASVTFVNVVSSQSPWAQYATSLKESDLENETLIIVRDTSTHSPRLSKGVIDGAPQWVVNDFSTKQRIIKSGTGWGRMPLHLVEQDIKQGKLTLLTSEDFQSLHAPIHLVRKRNRPSGLVAQQLWDMLNTGQV